MSAWLSIDPDFRAILTVLALVGRNPAIIEPLISTRPHQSDARPIHSARRMADLSRVFGGLSGKMIDFFRRLGDLSRQTINSSGKIIELSRQLANLSRQITDSSRQLMDSSRQLVDLSRRIVELSGQIADFPCVP
uniref:Uncharacterized protein n=1 Tax=Candidatus Kentrum sp. UNK TaxID=2126344 RepID=A0A450ZVU3_9GAMM|nr:MAG: hypothetical protein BECKUNK1418G_GA0071005_100162 [Candidatus Kentron sp. UNK]VFK69731.1 MAG: hypothetical protein BECKUNK1418H_GA0071006_101829 [Candidatus Kentron sp. UNK]